MNTQIAPIEKTVFDSVWAAVNEAEELDALDHGDENLMYSALEDYELYLLGKKTLATLTGHKVALRRRAYSIKNPGYKDDILVAALLLTAQLCDRPNESDYSQRIRFSLETYSLALNRKLFPFGW